MLRLASPCLLIAALAASVAAQPAGAQAEVLFRQGRELMTAGKYAEACATFEQSQKLEPATSTLINLAACREKLGQLATAWGLFLDAERQTRSAKDDATVQLHDIAQGKAKKLEPRVSKLTLNVPAASKLDGLEITRNKDRVEPVMWNRALPVDGGTYTIVARATGMADWSTEVVVGAEADTKVIDVPLLHKPTREVVTPPKPEPPRPEPPKPEPPRPEPSRHDEVRAKPNLVPYVVGGAGVAALGLAVGVSLWGSSTYNQAKAEMTSQARRDTLEHSANTKLYVGEGLAVVGVGCVGVAVWLYVSHRGERPSTAARRQLVVSPTGVALAGTF